MKHASNSAICYFFIQSLPPFLLLLLLPLHLAFVRAQNIGGWVSTPRLGSVYASAPGNKGDIDLEPQALSFSLSIRLRQNKAGWEEGNREGMSATEESKGEIA